MTFSPVPGLIQEGSPAGFEPVLPGLVVLLPLFGFLFNGIVALGVGRRAAAALRAGSDGSPPVRPRDGHKRWVALVGPGAIGLSFALALLNFAGMFHADLHDPVVIRYWSWMVAGSLEVDAALQLDQLSMIMMLVVTGVGFPIHVFSVGYMRDDPGYARYFSYLNLFVFFMLVLVLGANFPVMFVGWEGVGLCSYLLIGFWFQDREKSDAGKKAFIVNRIGDFGFLVATFLVFTTFGTLAFAEVFPEAPALLEYGGATVTAIALFLFLGAAGKSAQIPLHVWLPDAMAGPTPVSALIHAATMVTAGVYMIARASVLFALAPAASAVVATVGALTALLAATVALTQYDIKKVLAYSTISQLGYMFLGVGAGAYAAGIFHLTTHAFFKALLFLGSGAVIHAMHRALHRTHSRADPQDMRNMGGLRASMPITWIVMWIATLAIAGVWPLAGFFSKDEIVWYAGLAASGSYPTLFAILWALALATALLTAVYMTRLMAMTFHGANRTGREEARHLAEAPWVMTVPLIALAVLSVVGGWINVPEELAASLLGLGGALPASEWLHHWLEPVTASAAEIRYLHLGEAGHEAPVGGGEALWAGLSTLAALATVLVTARVAGRWRVANAAEASAPTGFKSLLFNKWYVDEFYDRFVVRPILAASRFAWRVVDAALIDGTVNGLGLATRAGGTFASLFQTGRVNTYALFLTLGVLAILGFVVF